jgi:two-component system phosphate regulon response regulator PhoB
MANKILLVEDDADLLEVLRLTFELEMPDCELITATDGEIAMQKARRFVPDLVVLDIMMPKKDGIEVCRELRADRRLSDVQVLMLSAKSEDTDVVLGLGVGADDYLAKPARPIELVARAKNLLRRAAVRGANGDEKTLIFGNLAIDPVRFELRIAGDAVELTPMQFKILYTLAKKPGRVYRRDELIDAAAGTDVIIIERNIDTHVKTVRKKLGDYADVIKTVRGVGYKFVE